MNHSLGVRGLERGSDLDRQTERLAGRQRAFGQRLAIDQLHDDVVGANIVDLADVGMVQSGDGLGFARKSIAELVGRRLDRDIAIEARIPGAVDLAHTALAEQRKDLIWTETVSCGKRHVLVEVESTSS
jgi:hypothetical protein